MLKLFSLFQGVAVDERKITFSVYIDGFPVAFVCNACLFMHRRGKRARQANEQNKIIVAFIFQFSSNSSKISNIRHKYRTRNQLDNLYGNDFSAKESKMYKRLPQRGDSPYKKSMKIFSKTGLITPSSILLSLIFWTVFVILVYFSYSWYKRASHPHSVGLKPTLIPSVKTSTTSATV